MVHDSVVISAEGVIEGEVQSRIVEQRRHIDSAELAGATGVGGTEGAALLQPGFFGAGVGDDDLTFVIASVKAAKAGGGRL